MDMRCSYCGTEVTTYPDNGICTSCGGKLPERPAGIRCPGCGTYSSGNFCSACGRPMPEAAIEPEPEDEAEYCIRCGAMRQGDSRYCAVCGAAFAAEDEALPAKPEAPAIEKPEPLEEPECTDPE